MLSHLAFDAFYRRAHILTQRYRHGGVGGDQVSVVPVHDHDRPACLPGEANAVAVVVLASRKRSVTPPEVSDQVIEQRR